MKLNSPVGIVLASMLAYLAMLLFGRVREAAIRWSRSKERRLVTRKEDLDRARGILGGKED